MNPTISEVAQLAGVSAGTVSRAYNGYTDIRPETKERIFLAAQKLGYHPNIAGRNLSSKRPPNIALILSGFLTDVDETDDMRYHVIRGCMEYTQLHQLELSLHTIDTDAQRKLSYLDFCSLHAISGAVVYGVKTDDEYFAEFMHSGIPIVGIDLPIGTGRVGWTSTDNRQAAEDAVRFLLERGHQRIAVMAGRPNAAVNQERLQGVQEALRGNGFHLDKENLLWGDFRMDAARQSLLRRLSAGIPDFTAIFCFSDVMALGCMQALEQKGCKVPKDISLMGFDGLPITRVVRPELSTVRQDMRQISFEATKMLHGMMTGRREGEHVICSHTLVEGASVADLRGKTA